MKAVVLNGFGKENLSVQDVKVPNISEDEVLIKIKYAGIGQWDRFERDGGYHDLLGLKEQFPYILGSEGSGEIVKTGKSVKKFSAGDLVYACSFLNKRGGFYAEYVSVKQDFVKLLPFNLSLIKGSSILGVGITALRGLEKLDVGKEDDLIIHGASGGVGHIAVQLSKKMCRRVLGIASQLDGVCLCENYGVRSINGKTKLSTEEFKGFNKMLLTTPLKDYKNHLQKMKTPATIAYPVGNYDVPENNDETIKVFPYYGELNEEIVNRFDNYVKEFNLKCHIDSVYNMKDFYEAHTHLERHYIGKLAFRVS